MDIIYQHHIDREIESLIERIHPPKVCIDNDSCSDCTLIKIDSANRHGILLEMVQAMTDLELVISKSYISSDGGWLMDVFHVTDLVGNKLTDKNLIHYIQQALCKARSTKEISREIELNNINKTKEHDTLSTSNILEITGTDRPGLFSEISAVLVDLGLNVTFATAWTHNDRVACIIYLEEASRPGPINDPIRLAHVQDQVKSIVEAHDNKGRRKQDEERRSVRLTKTFVASRNHTERRLHQLMYADKDYESCRACHVEGGDETRYDGTHVSIGRCEEKGYWVVNVRSRDRPKLLFDTVCVLTDMHYDVFHAAIDCKGSITDQEYYVRHMDSSTLDKESERQKLCLCLTAAIERRVSHASPKTPATKGLKVDIRAENRKGLLSNMTRVIRENGLSITKVHIQEEDDGKVAVGSFYVTDYSGQDVNPNNIAELVRREIGVSIVAVHTSPYNNSSVSQSPSNNNKGNNTEVGPMFSFGSMLWSQLERLRISNCWSC